jgi:starch phosphorylase
MTNKIPKKSAVAYFSMEFAIDANIPSYAGGLGVLAADILHSCADKGVPVVGVSLMYHQNDNPQEIFPTEKFMKKRTETITVRIEEREVLIGAYEYTVKTKYGTPIPIFFLTAYDPKNKPWDRDLTKYLYASDEYTRIGQEAILGIGGVRMLREMGYDIDIFHMNEGHSAFLTLELLKENEYSDEKVQQKCTFTTHTPIPAGHDYFEYPCVGKILGNMLPWHIRNIATNDHLSMTHLAMNLSKCSNSVAKKHREVCREMFPGYGFKNVTNGIHHLSWVSPAMAKLFNKKLPGWQENPSLFTSAEEHISDSEVLSAHKKNKRELIKWINGNRSFFPIHKDIIEDDYFDGDTLTITFARRFVPYKRADLIFHDLERLRDIGHKKIQLIFAGKCHRDDFFCNKLRERLRDAGRRLRSQIRVAITHYDINIAKKLVSGSDIWLNNPIKPREASGTSGMKAALNGVPNLSLLDGWWIEGYKMKPQSGWAFGESSDNISDEYERDRIDSKELYENLEKAIEEFYAENKKQWAKRMKASISLLSFFNTHRTVDEYYEKIWGNM